MPNEAVWKIPILFWYPAIETGNKIAVWQKTGATHGVNGYNVIKI